MQSFLTLAALALLAAPAFAAERIPGTKVSLEPPAGFIAASRFSGFQDEARGASIMVTELSAPSNQMRGTFTDSNLQARGMTLRSSESATFGRLEGDLMAVTQSVNGIAFDKWMAVTGDGTASILIVATYPQALAAQLSEPMRLAVLTARWDPAVASERFEGLPFSVRETADLKFDGRLHSSLHMTKPGDPRSRSAAAPFLVVTPSIGAMQPPDLEQFARLRIAQLPGLKQVGNLDGNPATIAGRPAYELTASANDQKTGMPQIVYQAAIRDGHGYYLVVGMAGAGGAATYLPQFKVIANSLRIEP